MLATQVVYCDIAVAQVPRQLPASIAQHAISACWGAHRLAIKHNRVASASHSACVCIGCGVRGAQPAPRVVPIQRQKKATT